MMSEAFTFYWLPNCSTCQKAASYLKQKGQTVTQFRDIKTDPLEREEVEQLAELAGGANELFSRRARKYRSMGLNEREIAGDEMLDLISEEYTFIKRPVLVNGKRAICGFSPKSYDSFLVTE
jgi:arsenate reductase